MKTVGARIFNFVGKLSAVLSAPGMFARIIGSNKIGRPMLQTDIIGFLNMDRLVVFHREGNYRFNGSDVIIQLRNVFPSRLL